MNSNALPKGSVLLLDALKAKSGLLFEAPHEVITTANLADVPAALERLEQVRAKGRHLAGYFAYELGFAFEEKLRARWQSTGEPLLWFGVYDAPQEVSLSDALALLAEGVDEAAEISCPKFGMDRANYNAAFEQVQAHLAKGDVYQVNLTLRAAFSHEGSPERQFLNLLKRQPVEYAALIKQNDLAILSLSPELFLERKGNLLRTKPMKGTASRGRDLDEDRRIAGELAADPKQRAENTMIVDLMRNDLSRIAETGSVKVRELCNVERYKSLHQMTSTIEAELKPDIKLPGIIARLFPCGSITGAPKLSAMQIANTLETGPRGVYTGSIGHIQPSGDFLFNVAIRTLVLNDDGTGEVGTGSGVIYDSGAAPEYDECALKLKFMTGTNTTFNLIETMAWMPGEGYLLLDRHFSRLTKSADYFQFEFPESRLREALAAGSSALVTPHRVRIELLENGEFELSATPFQSVASEDVWDLVIAEERTCSTNRFLYHKTTNRAFYDETRQRYAEASGCQEVLFENENGYLTEGSYTTLFIEKGGRLLTPALRHGLLPGTFREGLLEAGLAEEADLTRHDLACADVVYIGNSVRGLIRCRMLQAMPQNVQIADAASR